MIDFHTHILPNIDDGAENVEIATRLLQAEVEHGVSEIVFTPHYYGKTTVGQFLSLRVEALESIRGSIPNTVRFRSGAEVLMTGVNDPTDEALCALAVEGTKCVLMEFPFDTKWSERLFERVSDFIADTGYTPVIAHVERYAEALRNPSVVTFLARMGCYIQLNTRAFLDKESRRFAFALLKHGLVHCLGTDTHDENLRAPDYAAVKYAVEKAGYGSEWNEIQWSMGKILAGETVLKTFGRVKKFGMFYF